MLMITVIMKPTNAPNPTLPKASSHQLELLQKKKENKKIVLSGPFIADFRFKQCPEPLSEFLEVLGLDMHFAGSSDLGD